MKKPTFMLLPVMSLFVLTGCQQNQPDPTLQKASNTFFEAFNHMCEANSLQIQGSAETPTFSAEFTAAFTSQPQELALDIFFTDGHDIGFYIDDGKTYLNYMGTKSSSEASKIGISSTEEFHLPNPFLQLSREDRAEFFKSVEVHESQIDGQEATTYTFTINPTEANKLLDYYGAVKTDKAQLQATICDQEITGMIINFQGVYDLEVSQTNLSLSAQAQVIKMNEKVEVHFPADLHDGNWNAGTQSN